MTALICIEPALWFALGSAARSFILADFEGEMLGCDQLLIMWDSVGTVGFTCPFELTLGM